MEDSDQSTPPNKRPPTILITGANRGLGLHFVRQYLEKGWNVWGTYREESADDAHEVRLRAAHVGTMGELLTIPSLPIPTR